MNKPHFERYVGFSLGHKGFSKGCKRSVIWPKADGAQHSMNRPPVTNPTFADDNVSLAISELEPEHGITCQSGQGTEAATKGGAEVIVIWLKWCRDDELGAIIAFQRHPHGSREWDLFVQKVGGFLDEALMHGGMRFVSQVFTL